jgi:hypothetical protein
MANGIAMNGSEIQFPVSIREGIMDTVEMSYFCSWLRKGRSKE